MYIKISKDGPYLVHGMPVIKQEIITPNEAGNPWDYVDGKVFEKPDDGEDFVALCRCGHSKHAPFCDETHLEIGFDGTTTAPHEAIEDNAKIYRGENMTLLDNEAYCAFARFCDAYGQIWRLINQVGQTAEKPVMREAFHCPAGRLMLKDNQTGERLEPKLEQSVGVLEDPQAHCSGPLYIKGGITIEDENGKKYEIRNRVTVCRCGESANKPFCNGAHASVPFDDGIG